LIDHGYIKWIFNLQCHTLEYCKTIPVNTNDFYKVSFEWGKIPKSLYIFKIDYKAAVITIACYNINKDRDQWNQTDSPEVN
jgi:hypothetical protein